MLCNLEKTPTYIDRLAINSTAKEALKEKHNNVVMEILKLELDGSNLVKSIPAGNGKVFIGAGKSIATRRYAELVNKLGEINKREGGPIAQIRRISINGNEKYVVGVDVSMVSDIYDYITSEEAAYESMVSDAARLLAKDAYRGGNVTREQIAEVYKNKNSEAYVNYRMNEDLKNKIFSFLNKLNFTVEQNNDIIAKYGANAVANIVQKTIQYAYGQEVALPEEAAHVYVELLPQDHPLFREMMDKIQDDPIFPLVYEEYKDDEFYQDEDGNPDMFKIMKEAVGQRIAQEIYAINNNKKTSPEYRSLLTRLLDFIKALFLNKVNQDPAFAVAANNILEGNITLLTRDDFELEEQADFLYKSRQSDYDAVREDIELAGKNEELVNSLKNAINKVRKFKKTLTSEQDIEANKIFADIKRRLESLKITDENDQEDYIIEAVKTYTDFMKETDALYKVYLSRMRNVLLMENGDPKIAELNHLLQSTLLLNRFLQDLQDVTIYLEDSNPVSKFMDSILGTKSKLESTFRQVGMDVLQNVFANEIFGQDYYDLKAKVQARVDALEQQKTIPGAPIEQIDKSIEQEWEELEKLGPSEEKIKTLLNGTAGDMSYFSANLQRAIQSNDFLVSGLQKKFEEAIFENVKALMNTANKVDTAHREFIRNSGSNINNDESTYDPITEILKVTIGYDKEGKPIEREKVFLLREFDPTYKVELEQLRLKKSRIRSKLSQTTDSAEIAKLEEEYRELLKDQEELYKKLERKYTDKYYEMTEKVMDEVLTDDEGNKFTVREAVKDIYTTRANAYRDIELSQSLSSMQAAMAVIEDCDMQLKELKTLHDKVPGTKEYLIALQLKKYDKNMREVSTSKRTQKTDDLFNANLGMMQKLLKRGSITQEQFDIWKQVNTKRTFTDTYWAERKKILDEMNSIMDLYVKKDEKKKGLVKELYEKLEDLAKKYRDNDNYINGNEMTIEQMQDIKDIEQEIQNLKDTMAGLTGLTKAEKEELNQLRKDIANPAIDPDVEENIQARIDFLEQKEENFNETLDENHLDEYFALLEQLSSLSVTKNTTYYEERLEEEIAKYAATLTISPMKRRMISINKKSFKRNDSGWEAKDGEFLTFEEAEEKYRYQFAKNNVYTNTEWGKANHTFSSKWVANPNFDPNEEIDEVNFRGSYVKSFTPTYIWRYTEPADSIYIEEEGPAFKYYEKVVNDEYVNKNFKDEGGYPIPKKGFYTNKKYEALKNSTNPQDVARFRYLTMLNELLDEADKFIENPSDRAAGQVPTFEKGFFETISNPFSKEGIVQMGNYIGKEAFRAFKITEQDKESSYGETLSSEEVILKGMPVFHRSDLELNLQLRDATKAIMAYYAMVVKRHGVNKTKPMANILLKLVSEMDIKDPEVKNFVGKINKVLKKGSQSNRAKRIQELMESIYLGQNKKAAKVKLPWGEFDLGKVVDLLLTGSSISVLGFKPIANVKNNISGKFQIMLTSMTDPNVISTQNIGKAQGYVGIHMKDMIVDMTKSGNRSLIGQLADYFDFMQGEFMNDYGEKIDWSMIRTVADLKGFAMSIKGFAEMEQQYVLGIGILMTQMVKRNGQLIRMIDAYELKDGLLQPKDGVEIDRKQEMRVRSFIKEINSRANGNVNKIDAAVFEKYALGRMAYHMNKWFIPSAMYRIGSTNYNVQLNEIEAPIYTDALRSMYFLFKENGWNLAKAAKNRKYLRPREKKAQNTMLIESAAVLALFGLIALAGGHDPDRRKELKDDTAYNYFKSQYLALLLSTKTEIETLTPIFGIDNVLQKMGSPFVAISTLKLLRRTLIDGFTGAEYTKDSGFWEKGDSKFVADVSRLFAVEGLLKDLVKPLASFESIEKGQNFRN